MDLFNKFVDEITELLNDEESLKFFDKEDIPKMEEVLNKIKKLHEKKNSDYSEKPLDIIGVQGIVYFLVNKVLRLKNLLTKSGDINFESVKDNLRDVIVYGTLGLVQYVKGNFK